MADFYKVLKADPMGEPWTPSQPNAKPIQAYWCQVEGQEKAVRIGRQTDNPLRPGVHVYGDLMFAKSQKGTEYWNFKGQKIPDGVQRPTDSPSSPAQATAQASVGDMSGQMPSWFLPTHNMVKYIYDEMKKLETPTAEQQTKAFNDTMMEPVVSEPDEATKEMLDEIFGPADK